MEKQKSPTHIVNQPKDDNNQKPRKPRKPRKKRIRDRRDSKKPGMIETTNWGRWR